MLIGYFDFLILGVLLFLNIRLWNRDLQNTWFWLFVTLLYLVLLPMLSQIVEVQRVKQTIGIMDSFEVWYTVLRYPLYWSFGLIQGIALLFRYTRHIP